MSIFPHIHTYIHTELTEPVLYGVKGSFIGMSLTLTAGYFLYIHSHIHLYMQVLLGLAWLAVVYVVYLFCKTRPMTARGENLTSLAAKIIQSSPQEGMYVCMYVFMYVCMCDVGWMLFCAL